MSGQRILGLGLFVSLAVNVLLVGAMFGHHMRGPGAWLGGGHHRHHMAAQLEALSDETRPKVETIWQAHRAEMRHSFRDMHAARHALKDALTADVYDASAVDAALDQMDAALAAPRLHLAEAVRESAAVMSDEERKAFFERGLKGFGPPPHHPRPPKP